MLAQSMRTAQISLSALVLAGGQSSRMGRDKALIPVAKQSLLEKICLMAQSCTERVYVITPWIERYQEPMAAMTDVTWIREVRSPADPPPGPLVGFAQGWAEIETDWVLLLACDLPHLRNTVLHAWSQGLTTVSDQPVALLPRHPQGWWEPLCGFYPRRSRASLQAFVNQGGRSFQRWLDGQVVQELPLLDPEMIFNCNTPDDLQRIDNGENA